MYPASLFLLLAQDKKKHKKRTHESLRKSLILLSMEVKGIEPTTF